MSVTDKILMVPLAPTQYFDETTNKTQIYVHHTASSPNPHRVLEWWASTPERVATSFVIGGNPNGSKTYRDGSIIQCFGSAKWGYHLGLKKEHLVTGGKDNITLNKMSIGIEICNWGQLTKGPKGYTSYAGVVVKEPDIVEYKTPFRGFAYYQKYTDAQIASVHELLQFLCAKWNINTEYKGDAIFNIDKRALMGENGIFTHVSVRPDKNDCHPQNELKEALKSL